MNICTIVCRNYVAQARVLANSFRAHHPDADCVALIVDAEDLTAYRNEPFRAVSIDDLRIEDFPIMAGIYEPIELSTAVKPWLLRWMDQEYGSEGPVAYFDPDILVTSAFPELEAMLADHWCVLTPHYTDTQPLDDRSPSEQAILLSGTYNLGFIALRRGPDLDRFIDWWQERLRWDCVVDTANGFFVDQRYIDLVPGLFDGVGILRHDGYNVAYWNLAARKVEAGAQGIEINGLPLRFFHFSGFDPRVPQEISKHQDRVAMAADSELARVFAEYADRLLSAGFLDTCDVPYALAQSAGGRRLSRSVRAVYRAAVMDGFGESLFEPSGDEDFATLLASTDRKAGRIPQGLAYLWAVTPELRAQYPDLCYRDRSDFLDWCAREDVSLRLLSGYVESHGRSRLVGARKRPLGVNVVGYLNAESGVGEAARGVVGLLDEAGAPVWPVALEAPGVPNRHPFRVPGGTADLPFRNTLVCVNADMLPHLAPSLARIGLTQTEVTGLWWWETETFPKEFEPAFAWVDRVVAGTTFVRDAIARAGRVPVASFPLPVTVGPIAEVPPAEIDWPAGYVFLFSFDYASVFRRKNPDGLLAAYVDAFAPEDGAALVIKTINAERDPVHHAELVAAAAGRSDVRIIDGFLRAADRNWLTASCDCYVSLHRSEGFGLTMAEAMYLGKPVIATGYSGNLDFMSTHNSLLVDYSFAAVGPGAAPYDAAGTWAEPRLDDAAAKLRWVFDHRAEAAELGAAGAQSIRRTHSPVRGAEVLTAILLSDDDG